VIERPVEPTDLVPTLERCWDSRPVKPRQTSDGNCVTMPPADLQPAQFAGYPPKARQLAIEHLDLLRRLPLSFVPLLLREVIAYDWKFPAERRELENQFLYLAELDTGRFQQVLKPFAKLQLPPSWSGPTG